MRKSRVGKDITKVEKKWGGKVYYKSRSKVERERSEGKWRESSERN